MSRPTVDYWPHFFGRKTFFPFSGLPVWWLRGCWATGTPQLQVNHSWACRVAAAHKKKNKSSNAGSKGPVAAFRYFDHCSSWKCKTSIWTSRNVFVTYLLQMRRLWRAVAPRNHHHHLLVWHVQYVIICTGVCFFTDLESVGRETGLKSQSGVLCTKGKTCQSEQSFVNSLWCS